MENDIKTKQERRFLKGYALDPDVLIQGEKILFQAKPLPWLKLGEPLVAIIIALAFLLILPYLSRTYPEVGQTEFVDFWIILRWFGIGILAIGTISMVARWFKWYFRIYIVTNKRVIEGSGTIGRSGGAGGGAATLTPDGSSGLDTNVDKGSSCGAWAPLPTS